MTSLDMERGDEWRNDTKWEGLKRIEQRRTLSSHMNEQAKQTQQSQSKPSHASYTISNNANHTHHNTTTVIPPSPINHLPSHLHPSNTPPSLLLFLFEKGGSTSESPHLGYTVSQSRIMRMEEESCGGCGCSLFLCFEVLWSAFSCKSRVWWRVWLLAADDYHICYSWYSMMSINQDLWGLPWYSNPFAMKIRLFRHELR